MMTDQFEPTIIGFTCNWCSYRAADTAGTARMKYAPNVRLIRLMCSGRLDPTFVLKAFADGADGVMITGCHPGDCHYVEQNFKPCGVHPLKHCSSVTSNGSRASLGKRGRAVCRETIIRGRDPQAGSIELGQCGPWTADHCPS
jgi:hypothetical protein